MDFCELHNLGRIESADEHGEGCVAGGELPRPGALPALQQLAVRGQEAQLALEDAPAALAQLSAVAQHLPVGRVLRFQAPFLKLIREQDDDTEEDSN